LFQIKRETIAEKEEEGRGGKYWHGGKLSGVDLPHLSSISDFHKKRNWRERDGNKVWAGVTKM